LFLFRATKKGISPRGSELRHSITEKLERRAASGSLS
jgi:hypothetical protein